MIRGNETAIDLGLEVLAALKPMEVLTYDEIAAYIDAAREVLCLKTEPFRRQDLLYLENRALVKMRKSASRREREDEHVIESVGLKSHEIMLLTDRKARYGRGGLPEHIARAMVADYHRTKSLAQTARNFKRTRQAMWDILRRRTKLRPLYKRLHEPTYHNGQKFTPGKGGYLRLTSARGRSRGDETLLHRLVWIEHNGAIPKDHEIHFRDGDRTNCAIKNLYCVHRHEASRGRKSGNDWTKFYAGLGPRPQRPRVTSERLSAALRLTWAGYTADQRAARLAHVRRGHQRWLVSRKKLEVAA